MEYIKRINDKCLDDLLINFLKEIRIKKENNIKLEPNKPKE
jgi:hypothetical protein